MPDNTLIYANKNIVYVNTAIDSNAIVFLSNASYFGQTVTIKDSAGKAGPSNIIRITTCNDVSYLDPTLSNLTIQQPFGYLTFTASSEKKWSLANTFAFDTMFTSATINTPNLNTILYKDTFSNGSISIMSVNNNNLLINNQPIQNINTTPIEITNPLITNTIRASNIIINTSNTSNTLYFSAGYNTSFNNVQVSYDTSSWSAATVNFNNGFASKILHVNNHLIALGGIEIEVEENVAYNYYWQIKTSFNNINWITRKTELFSQNSLIPILNNVLFDIKYANGYYVLLTGIKSTDYSSLYYSTNLNDWISINDTTPLGFCKSFEIDSNNNVFIGDITTLYIYNLEQKVLNNYPLIAQYNDLPIYIDKIKYLDSQNYIISGYTSNNDSGKRKITSTIDSLADIYSAVKLNQRLTDESFITNNNFTVNDIYVNQNTPNEVGLPTILYVGSTSTNNNTCIYYTFCNINDQSNITPINITSEGYFLSNIYSIYYYNKQLFLASDGLAGSTVAPLNLIILDSNTINGSGTPFKRDNNLITTYSYQIIENYSPINSNLLNISGKMTTNFLSLSNISLSSSLPNQTISSSNNILYRNNYAINPVGAHIEFRDSSSNFSTYPLYIGSLSNFNSGWWDKTTTKNVSAFIVEPGYYLRAYSEPNYTLPLICSVSNTTQNPIYSNVYNINNSYSNASYILTSLS